jgi:hypothetical protein
MKYAIRVIRTNLKFSPGIPASSTTKIGRHDIAEILLEVALKTKNQINSNRKQNRGRNC